jgi:TetR/AcrR family transcriptional regulator, regulator of autoinduction and epiphytic fitness
LAGVTVGALQATDVDGRNQRRLQSMDRAVAAVLDLIIDGVPAPTAQQIADRSGISIRTVFRLTEDVESLHAAALQLQTERVRPLYVDLPTGGALASRMKAIVENRALIYETIAPVRRVAEGLAWRSPRIAEGLAANHQFLRTQVATVFGTELSGVGGRMRMDALHAADVATSWETWEQCRRLQGLSVAESSRCVRLLLRGALQAAASPMPDTQAGPKPPTTRST